MFEVRALRVLLTISSCAVIVPQNHCYSFLSFFKPSLISSLQSSEVLGTQLVALESEKAELVQSLSKVEAELAVRGEELERVQSSLATERESGVKTAEALQNQLNEKVKSS